jgi:hypothetical protein
MATEPLSLDWISATLPKAGHRREENEDAVAAAPGRLRFALADGATEGWESGAWAARLAEAYIRRPPTPGDFPAWLAAVRRDWRPQTAAPGPIAWYTTEKQQQGSYATLVGLELRPARDKPGRWGWKAVAIGDSCLVHVHDGNVQAAFPLTARDEFGDSPALVPSSSAVACPEPDWLAGFAGADDVLLLASDATAAHLLHPPGLASATAALGASLLARDRAPLLNWLREVQSVMNDDVSVIAVRIPSAPEAA